jgi:hypothetical protein
MTWLIAHTSRSSYIYQLTDKYAFWEFTLYSTFPYKICEGLHARILRFIRCTTLGWETLHFLLSDRNSIQSSLIKIHYFSVYNF